MNKYIKLSFLAAAMIAVLATASCSRKEVNTDQLSGPIALAAVSPNPVVRGAELHLFGTNLDKVVEVRIPGVDPIKDITKGEGQGRLSEIVVTVPLEGPQVGKVVVADASGNTSSTKFDLEYIEGMVFEGFTCDEEVMPGDVITLKGEYLNNIQEVIFTSGNGITYATGAMIFDKTRHSTKVYVPAAATSGIIKICDVDETKDKTSIPNIYPSTKEIVVGKPTVDVTEFEEPVKAGTILTFTGTYLNMVAKVVFGGEEQKDFTVSDDATELSAALPEKAADGDVIFTTYAGDTFVAGTLVGVLPSALSIAVDETMGDLRYKAGYRTVILGDDLDLVEAVSFGGANAEFEYRAESFPDSIVAVIPEIAPDGDVVLTLANGSSVVVDQVAFVNPTVDKVSTDKIVAREKFEFTGKDLELIRKVSVGGIECQFTLDTLDVVDGLDEEGDPIKIAVLDSTKVIVTTDPTILSGDVVIEKLNGWSNVISQMAVTYEELVSLELPASVAMGKPMVVTGTNLFAIDKVYIKGKQVVDWVSRSNTQMSFQIPEGVGPGVYRLVLDLNDGTTITWAIGFEVTAPYTETFVWEGKHDLAAWGANLEAGPEDGWVQAGIKEGDVVRIYYETYEDDWQFKLQAGHWDAINLETLGGANIVSPDFAASGDTFFSFEVTADILAQLTKTGEGWGYTFVINGTGAYIKGISMIHFGATEKVIYEGPTSMTWGDDGRFGLALQYFEEAGADATMVIYFQQTENWGQVQINDGWWKNDEMVFPELGGAYLTTDNAGGKEVTKIELTITEDMLNLLKSHAGDYFGLNTQYQGDGRVAMVLQGSDWIIEQITLK